MTLPRTQDLPEFFILVEELEAMQVAFARVAQAIREAPPHTWVEVAPLLRTVAQLYNLHHTVEARAALTPTLGRLWGAPAMEKLAQDDRTFQLGLDDLVARVDQADNPAAAQRVVDQLQHHLQSTLPWLYRVSFRAFDDEDLWDAAVAIDRAVDGCGRVARLQLLEACLAHGERHAAVHEQQDAAGV